MQQQHNQRPHGGLNIISFSRSHMHLIDLKHCGPSGLKVSKQAYNVDRIELYLECLRHKHMDIVEVMRVKMLIPYLTQLKNHISSVTPIECQKTWTVYSAKLIAVIQKPHIYVYLLQKFWEDYLALFYNHLLITSDQNL